MDTGNALNRQRSESDAEESINRLAEEEIKWVKARLNREKGMEREIAEVIEERDYFSSRAYKVEGEMFREGLISFSIIILVWF